MLTPIADRTPLHHRQVNYRGYARPDGLWDIEGEMRDTKSYDATGHNGARAAGTPVHHMHICVTLDDTLRIHAIQTDMEARPFGECAGADNSLQGLVGQTIGPGWRQAIERASGGTQGCTHMRELLYNLATAALQTIPQAIEVRRIARGEPRPELTEPPHYMGKCQTWDFNGAVVARLAPQFIDWKRPARRET